MARAPRIGSIWLGVTGSGGHEWGMREGSSGGHWGEGAARLGPRRGGGTASLAVGRCRPGRSDPWTHFHAATAPPATAFDTDFGVLVSAARLAQSSQPLDDPPRYPQAVVRAL